MKRLIAVLVAGMILFPWSNTMGADAKPTISVRQEKWGEKTLTMVGIAVPTIPGFECDVWCYEDALGQGESSPQADGIMIVRHKHPKGAEVETKLVPSQGAVDWYVTVTGPTPQAVKAVTSVNGCWQLRRAPGFQSLKDQFVESFVNQCFIYTDRGFTFLKDTKRFPDTRRPPTDKTNSPPWVQNYIPAWIPHPGQPKAFWGSSTDQPIYSIAGVVSRDMKHLAAWGCRKCRGIGQGWHDCLHVTPDMGANYDEKANRTVTRMKMYFMEAEGADARASVPKAPRGAPSAPLRYDGAKLLEMYKRDFGLQ